ncbi:phage tail fiber protein [Caldimonas sp. KR1-144]|uniref:phage tail fiber protein n=1 Tax=Caldimonas sp. KR1-144 TaxID=3400911 RepID=UPI003C105808
MPLAVAAINELIDYYFRGASAPTLPANFYYTLLSAIPSGGSPNGTEITAGGVTRQARARNTTQWSGTQGAGTTGASTGTTTPGITRNNDKITFAASASADVSGAVAVGLFDASTGGNLKVWAYIRNSGGTPVTRNWLAGDEIAIEISAMQWQLS